MKTCSKCGETKSVAEFHKKTASKDGLNKSCKACINERIKAHYQANRERILAEKRSYRAANRERILAEKKIYYEANRERIRAESRAYHEANRERVLRRLAAYRSVNRNDLAERQRVYYDANRDRLLKTGRRAVDPLSRNGFVYRMYDANDQLLYVGLTYNIENRFFRDPSNHADTKPWFNEITFVWVEEFETYADAQEEERHAYAEENPIHNKAPLYPTGDRPVPVAASEYDLEGRILVDLEVAA